MHGGFGLGVAAALASTAACLVTPRYPPLAKIECPACETPGPRPPGTELVVFSSWRSECPNPLDFKEVEVGEVEFDDVEVGDVFCAGKRYRLRVRCTGPCTVHGAGIEPGTARAVTGTEIVGAGSIVITPTEVGPFAFEVELERLDTGEHVRYRSPDMMIGVTIRATSTPAT